MKFDTKKHALLLAQAIINPQAVKAAADRANPDDCEAPPCNAEMQASLAVGDLLHQGLCGMDVRWEAVSTLGAAAQHAADLHADDTADLFDYWRRKNPCKDYSAEDIARNRVYFETHSHAAQVFSAAMHDALKRYSADIKRAESL
jgi:hypothetical protein